MSTKPSSSSTSRSVRSGIENQKFVRSARHSSFGDLRFACSSSITVERKEAALEIRGICHCEIQLRSAEVLEHLSHGEKRAAARAPLEAVFARRYERTRGLRNRSANGEAARRR